MTPVKDADAGVASALMPTPPGLPAGITNRVRIPSLLEVVRDLSAAGHDFTDPAIADQLPQDDVTRFCLRHDIMRDQIHQLRAGNTPYKVLIKNGLLQNIRLNLLLYEEGDPLPPTREAIPVAELHRPKVTGCVSAYALSDSKTRDAGLHLTTRGIDAGAGLSLTLTFERTISTEISCIWITVPVEYVVTPWKNPDSNRIISVVSVTDVFSADCDLVTIPDDVPTHLCSGREHVYAARVTEHVKRGGKAAAGISVRKSGPPGTTIEDKLAVEQSRSFSLKWGDVLELSSQFTRQYSYTFTLLGGAAYLGFRQDPTSEAFFWTWKTPG